MIQVKTQVIDRHPDDGQAAQGIEASESVRAVKAGRNRHGSEFTQMFFGHSAASQYKPAQ